MFKPAAPQTDAHQNEYIIAPPSPRKVFWAEVMGCNARA